MAQSSTTEKLISSIFQYLDAKNTDYALMVNGVWGSGKTYFVKNQLFPELEKKYKGLKLIYISLFGVTSSSDLNRKIFLEVYPILNSKVAKTVGILGKAVLSNLGINTLDSDDQGKALELIAKIDSNTLVVFDDLERLDSDLLIEILGFINQMVEHSGIKVIISANEDEIIENHAVDVPNYSRYLEKIVRHKLTFEPDFSKTAELVMSSCGIDTKHQAPILEAFIKGECQNLRTLQFASSLSARVLGSLSKAEIKNEDLKNHVTAVCTYFLASLSIESKLSRLSYLEMKKLASWSMDKPSSFADIDFSKLEVVREGNKRKLKAKEGNPQQDYFDKYFDPNQLMYIDSIVEYLESGFWDETKFIAEIEQVSNYFETRGVSESNRSLDRLLNFMQLNDQDVPDVVGKVIEFARKGEYQITKYLQIYSIVKHLIDIAVLNYDAKRLHDEILEGINACKDKEAAHYIEDFISIPASASQEEKNLYARTLSRNQEIKTTDLSDTSKEHFNLFMTDPNGYAQKYLNVQGQRIPCFHFVCSPVEFVKRYSEAPNNLKSDLSGVFYQRQKNGVQMDRKEIEWMRDLRKEMASSSHEGKGSISNLNKTKFVKVLDKLIEWWSQIEKDLD